MTTNEIRALRAKAIAEGDAVMQQMCATALRLKPIGGITADDYTAMQDAASVEADSLLAAYLDSVDGRFPIAMRDITEWVCGQMEIANRHGDHTAVLACEEIFAALNALESRP